KAAAAFTRIGLNGRLSFFIRQRVRRHRFCVIDAADDDGLIRVAFEKIRDDFHTDTWYEHRAPLFAGPGLSHAHPARRSAVVFTLAVPMKLYFHATVFVGKDFFA